MSQIILPPKERYAFQWLGRCQYNSHDKFWGWFYYNPTMSSYSRIVPTACYAFWGNKGHIAHVKKHTANKWQMSYLVNKKKSNKYKRISVEEFELIWPTCWTDLEPHFIFYMLSEYNN